MRSLSSPAPVCTLVLPTYNAADFITETVARLRAFLRGHPDWVVLFVCDGCTDGTVEQLAGLIAGDAHNMRAEVYPVNRGKGYALRRGLSLADTPYRIFTDVDLAYDPDEAVKILDRLREGADLAVVNRADPASRFWISPSEFPNLYKRHLMSRIFNWFVRQMLPIRIRDTQAGLKGITAAAWNRLAPAMRTDGFFFDVELLARAGAAGLRTAETPVVFRYCSPTTVRLVKHGLNMIRDTIRLRSELNRDGLVPRSPSVSDRNAVLSSPKSAFEPPPAELAVPNRAHAELTAPAPGAAS